MSIHTTSKIDGEFNGFDDEVLFKLQDGTYWLQLEYKYWYHYAYMPSVLILKEGNKYFLRLEDYGQQVLVTQVTDVIESNIEGEFKGWEGETKYTLVNGQTWQQSQYKYEYKYSYRPRVIIYRASGGYKMLVEGTCAPVRRIT